MRQSRAVDAVTECRWTGNLGVIVSRVTAPPGSIRAPLARSNAKGIASARGIPLGGLIAPEASVDLPKIEVGQDFAEVMIVEHLLEDRLVCVHPGHDGVEELRVEHQPEVLQRVVARLLRKF